MIGLVFQGASVADVEAVVALTQSAYRGDTSRRGWTTEADLLDGQRTDVESVVTILSDPHSMLLLARIAQRPCLDNSTTGQGVAEIEEGALVACAHIMRRGEGAWFGMFSVCPNRQRSGLGRRVLAEAERIASEVWGCREMRMRVIDLREELLQWYQRRGYRRTGEYECFPYGDPRFGLPRRDDLRFEILAKQLPVAGA